LGDPAEVNELGEEAFEPCRGDDFEDSARLVAGVPERVPLSARFVDEVPLACLDVLVTQQCAHTSLNDEAVLVLVVMAVQRRGERSWRHWMLDEREAISGFGTVEHETHSDASKKAGVPIGGSDDFCCGDAHASSFHWTIMSHQM
jgi:hypothetical protein